MPILVRPVREQLEHDRIIRLLEAKWRRKFKVEANPGDERNAGVKVPAGTLYPDLVLTEEGGRKPKALVEVETNESVNHLEAMAQWANLAKSRTSLFLFVPVGAVEAARRLTTENSIKLAELWTYLVLGDQVRFTSVFREDGAEPADLIEKVEVFTTERAAPAPRPVPVEVVEPPAPPPEPERPRKLAVKVGSRPIDIDSPAAKFAAKFPAKAGSRTIAPALAVPDPPAAALAAPARAAAKAAPSKVVAPAKPAPNAHAGTAAKAGGKPDAPARPAASGKSAGVAGKPPVVAARPASAKPAALKPAAVAGKVGPVKPEKKAAEKPAEKPAARKAVGQPKREVEKKAIAKAAPPAKKPAPKAAARPVTRKAVPVRPAARAASAKKAVAVPVAKARPSKRK